MVSNPGISFSSFTALQAFKPMSFLSGARWQAVVSVFCALPPIPRRAIHRACCSAIVPGGIFFYQGFAPSEPAADSSQSSRNGGLVDSTLPARAANSDDCHLRPLSGEELTKSQKSRPHLLAGPKDPALLATPATLLEELEGLKLDVSTRAVNTGETLEIISSASAR